MQDTINTILAAKRKSFLSSKPIFNYHAAATEMELFLTARRLECKMVVDLCQWLRAAGFGDINGSLMFRQEYFSLVSHGALSGCVTFAHDEVGNAYAFKPAEGSIYFISLHENGYAQLSDSFRHFLDELIRRDYNLASWRESLKLQSDE